MSDFELVLQRSAELVARSRQLIARSHTASGTVTACIQITTLTIFKTQAMIKEADQRIASCWGLNLASRPETRSRPRRPTTQVTRITSQTADRSQTAYIEVGPVNTILILEKLLDIDRAIGREDISAIRRKIIDAQDCILSMQKAQMENTRLAAARVFPQ
jgi:hypothetical protein